MKEESIMAGTTKLSVEKARLTLSRAYVGNVYESHFVHSCLLSKLCCGRATMRALAISVLLLLGLTIWPAQAQMYDSAYPVCLQTYGPQSGISCRFTSMAPCRTLASGRSAQCIANPYYGKRRRPG
jgi:hypothetical protein